VKMIHHDNFMVPYLWEKNEWPQILEEVSLCVKSATSALFDPPRREAHPQFAVQCLGPNQFNLRVDQCWIVLALSAVV
jgi:hypothetical protein